MTASGKTTLEVLIERIDWIRGHVEKLGHEHQELRVEIRTDLVNVGDLETLRANYIAADNREIAAREKDIEEIKAALTELRTMAEDIKKTYVSWYMMRWIAAVSALILAIIAGVNKDQIIQWILKHI